MRRRAIGVALLASASVACVAYFASVHLLMGYADRFLYPYGQTLLATLIAPAWLLPLILNSKGNRVSVGIIALFALAVLATGWTAWKVVPRGLQCYSIIEGNNRLITGYTDIGRAIDPVAMRVGKQLTLYHHNMGELMYNAPHWDSVDPIGLVDRYTAHHGFSVDHVFERRPDLFILPSLSKSTITVYRGEFFPDISQAIYADRRMAEYRYLGHFPPMPFGPEGRLHFFLSAQLDDANPWIARELIHSLGLVVDPAFAANVEIARMPGSRVGGRP
jgi:hypothetical protein